MPMILAGLAACLGSEPKMMPAHNTGSHYHRHTNFVDWASSKTVGSYLVVVALAYSHRQKIAFSRPSRSATFLENLIMMIGHVDENSRPDPIRLECLKHAGSQAADHEITNSTFSFLVTASSLADPISALISALSAGYGPLHMGACESIYTAMQMMRGPEDAHIVIDATKSGRQRLFGYGHRIWRTVDPRIAHFKKID